MSTVVRIEGIAARESVEQRSKDKEPNDNERGEKHLFLPGHRSVPAL